MNYNFVIQYNYMLRTKNIVYGICSEFRVLINQQPYNSPDSYDGKRSDFLEI